MTKQKDVNKEPQVNKQTQLNKLNSFLDKATQSILCDSKCQKNKTTEELKNKYLNLKTNLVLAKPQYDEAKKNYYTFISGEDGYNEILENELNTEADNIITNFKKSLNEDIDKIKIELETYNGILINFKNVEELNNQYKKENVLLLNKLKEESNDILTNDRKTYYEDQEIVSLKNYYSYILIVIYIIVVICLGVFSQIYPSQSSLKIRVFLFIFFIILPFISTFVFGKIIQMIYLLYSLLPKNVYKNI
jgi:hypothetical protein